MFKDFQLSCLNLTKQIIIASLEVIPKEMLITEIRLIPAEAFLEISDEMHTNEE